MTAVREAMIVAGGAGRRLWPLTRDTPKPLLELCGTPFLVGVLRRLAAVGVRRTVLVVGADTAPFAVLSGPARQLGIELVFAAEPEPLDTAGGVRGALDHVSGPFLVLNGDILTDLDLTALIAAHRRSEADATLALTRVDDVSSYGVCVRRGTRITGFLEKPDPGTVPGQDTVNAGTYVLEPAALQRFPTGRLSFERDVFPGLLEASAVIEGFVSDAVWADLGTPGRLLEGHRLVLDGSVSWPPLGDVPERERRVWVADDAVVDPTARLHAPVIVAAGAVVAGGASVGPYTVLGAGGRVGDGARVAWSVLNTGAVVGHGARLDDALVGASAVIGAGSSVGSTAVVAAGEVVPDGRRVLAGATVPAGGDAG